LSGYQPAVRHWKLWVRTRCGIIRGKRHVAPGAEGKPRRARTARRDDRYRTNGTLL
jgi:hypothetical protein